MLIKTLEGHTQGVISVGLSKDEQWLVSGSDDRTLIVWSATTWNPVTTLRGHAGRILHVEFSADCRNIVSSATDSLIKVWAPNLQSKQMTPNVQHFKGVTAVTADINDTMIVTASSDNTIVIWDSVTKIPRHTLQVANVNCVALSPNAKTLAFAGGNDFAIGVFDIQSEKVIGSMKDHSRNVTHCHFLNNSTLITSSKDKTLKVWNTESLTLTKTIKCHDDSILHFAVHPTDANLIATASSDKTAKIVNHGTSSVVATLIGHREPVNCIAFANDGRIVTGSSDLTVRIWKAEGASGWKEQMMIEGHSKLIAAVAFISELNLVVTGSHDKTLRVWKVMEKEEKKKSAELVTMFQMGSICTSHMPPHLAENRTIATSDYAGNVYYLRLHA